MFVALKEITLQEEEGIPFTAIREGKNIVNKILPVSYTHLTLPTKA